MKSFKKILEQSGAGDWGTDKARERLQKDTPGQPIKGIIKTEDSPCWDSHKQVGMKKKGNKMVPNCVPKEEVQEGSFYGRDDLVKQFATPKKDRHKYIKLRKTDSSGTKGVSMARKGNEDKIKDYLSRGYKEVPIESVDEGSESWEAGYKRRVVKTTKPEHKEKGYNWRIKGKDKSHLTIKLYKDKPSQAEFNKQMKRVAGHEFGG